MKNPVFESAASRTRGALALTLFVLPSCAQILDVPDGETLELVPSGPWRCLESASERSPPIEETATVRFRACDFISGCSSPVTGLSARLCDKLDVGCNSPRQVDIRDTAGLIELEVPTGEQGFDGYLEVSAPLAPCYDTSVFGNAALGLLCELAPECNTLEPTDACNVPVYTPVLWFFNPPVTADIEEPIPLELYPSASCRSWWTRRAARSSRAPQPCS